MNGVVGHSRLDSAWIVTPGGGAILVQIPERMAPTAATMVESPRQAPPTRVCVTLDWSKTFVVVVSASQIRCEPSTGFVDAQ